MCFVMRSYFSCLAPALVTGILLLLCSASLCRAAGIVVLTRDDIVPYGVFVQAFLESAPQRTAASDAVQVFSVHGLSAEEEQSVIARITDCAPALLLAVGSGAFSFARTYFSTIPCVSSMVLNPALLQPVVGMNTACLRMEVCLYEKLAVLKQILPGLQRVGAVYDPLQCDDQVQLLQEAASRLGITVEVRPISSTKMAIHAFEDIMGHVDALVMLYDKTVLAPQSLQHMYTLSFRHRVPIVGISEKYVRLGALFSLDVDIRDLGRWAREWASGCLRADRLCTGIHYPEARWNLFVNTTVAPKMNITVPDTMLGNAVVVK